MPLHLSEADIESLLDMPAALEAVRGAFVALAQGEAENVPRVRAKGPGVVLHSLNAAAGYLGLVGWKQYVTTKAGAKFLVGLHDAKSGELLALIEADRLGQMRTGAVTGIAAELLTTSACESCGLIGAGWQAESQLEAVTNTLQLREIKVFARDPGRRASFAARMSARLNVRVTPVDEPRAAVEYHPLVITATSSPTPVFDARWLTRGALVCAVGSNWLHKSELEPDVFRQADLVVCDSIAACRQEAGEFIQPLAQGLFHWDRAVELAAMVNKQHPGRTSMDQIAVFKSVGLGIEDVALASVALERARARGVGRTWTA